MLNIIFILTILNTCLLLILLTKKEKDDNIEITLDEKKLDRLISSNNKAK